MIGTRDRVALWIVGAVIVIVVGVFAVLAVLDNRSESGGTNCGPLSTDIRCPVPTTSR